MGCCFLGCFLSSKRRKKNNSGSPRRKIDGGNVTSVDQVVCAPEKAINLVPESSEECVERQVSLNKQKRVTFDSNVETFDISCYGSTDSIVVSNNVIDVDDDERKNEDGIDDSIESITFCVGDLGSSDVGSHPQTQNNRYQNFRDSDDEAMECDDEVNVLVEVDDDSDNKNDDEGMLREEVWSEAIPTASLESRKDMSLTGVDLQEVNSPVVSSGIFENVLSPVGNLNQWKAVNAKGSQPVKAQEKENFTADGEAPPISYSSELKIKESSFTSKPLSHHQAENQNNDTSLDSSLSNWLGSSGTKTRSVEEGSPLVRNIEDRPILGAWTHEEVKVFSASPPPRKSPRRNPDDRPIIGTVGTYWKHGNEAEDCVSATSCEKKNLRSPTSCKGIPNTTSKYRLQRG
ncbi:nuclear polyadenylated RNA-binding protein 3-like [Heracleum sosnowskyi]|uniref:Nuclear polyadenylated RNA-binding protein 3-like n=1 Tax=Heracleum sosnowskyi TaxID=360622 RepID=A0AAD8GS04_9APIA|nr:nuclear polyadenylated RNA-binding protein 3-like [Heracleum sosnowskyi]